MQLDPAHLITDEAALRDHFPATHDLAARKSLDHLDRYARDFIARSPFLCIGTEGPATGADVSPRGDPPGFVRIVDDRTLLIPDRPGNNRLDTLANIVAHPTVGLLFLVPGFDETLRINGQARITRDPAVLDLMKVQDRAPRVAIVVTVTEVFLHCAKAFRRSQLWDPDARQDRGEMPGLMRMLMDQTSDAPVDPAEAAARDADLEDRYKQSMY